MEDKGVSIGDSIPGIVGGCLIGVVFNQMDNLNDIVMMAARDATNKAESRWVNGARHG